RPEFALILSTITVPDFMDMLEELDMTAEDRETKLMALEQLIMNRNLHVRIIPSGRAVEHGFLSSKYGKRIDPFTGKQENHKGIDISSKEGSLKTREDFRLSPPMVTLRINGGRKNKVRAGDILGALTANTNLPGKQIGKIDISDYHAHVAVERPVAKQALKILAEGKIKGHRFRIRKLR
ncbi:unnamed protein product, partial [marine sediment metagenome]